MHGEVGNGEVGIGSSMNREDATLILRSCVRVAVGGGGDGHSVSDVTAGVACHSLNARSITDVSSSCYDTMFMVYRTNVFYHASMSQHTFIGNSLTSS